MNRFTLLPVSALLIMLLTLSNGCQDPGSTAGDNSSNGGDGGTAQHDHDHGDHDHGDHDHGDHDHGDHDHGDHDHGDHDHGDHDHGDHGDHDHGSDPSLPPGSEDHEAHKGPETYDEAVSELLSTSKSIADAFGAKKPDDAHGPLHEVGHLLGATEALVEKSQMDDATKKQLLGAIEQLFEAYTAVDDKMHDAEKGKDYSEVSEQVQKAISTLEAQATSQKE